MENSSADIKVIIMFSDGVPAHQIDEAYVWRTKIKKLQVYYTYILVYNNR